MVEFITRDAQTVLDTDDLKVVLDLMGAKQIRRAPVVDKHGRVVGVVSLGDLSTRVKENTPARRWKASRVKVCVTAPRHRASRIVIHPVRPE